MADPRRADEPLQAGALPASEGLSSVLRLLDALERLSLESLSELTAAARETSLVHLESVESELAVRLPYDVLTLAVLRIPLLRRAVGLHVAHLARPVRDCDGAFGAPRGWVAVASFGKDAMRRDVELAQAGYDTLLCISSKASREGDPVVRTVDATGPSRPSELSSLIRERLTRRYGLEPSWMQASREAKDESRAARCCLDVTVVDDRPPAPAASRTRHARFGLGTVVRTEGDKVEVLFDSGETKVLLRRFLADA